MNLKKFYDATVAAEARVQTIAAQIDTAFEAGDTPKAMELKPQLDAAKVEATNANTLYLAMRDVVGDNGTPKDLKPVGGVQVIKDEADQPFESRGHFFMAVMNAALHPAQEDIRLRSVASPRVRNASGMSEGVPAEGGYLVKPEYASGWIEKMFNVGQILSRVANDPVTGDSMTYNGVDETSRADGSRRGGILGYWVGEGVAPTASKSKWYQLELETKEVAALCYCTNKQLRDTANLDSWLNRVVPEELQFKAEDAFVEGDGVAKPLGIMNSPCVISVTRKDGNKIQFEDIAGMWARRWAGVKDYVWLYNQDCNGQLDSLALTVGSEVVPPRFVDYGPDGVMRIKGAPALEVEYCQSLGTSGDIMLASLSQYQVITGGGIIPASSIHVAFTTRETAFLFSWALDGGPLWNDDLTPFHGSNSQSPFVVLSTSS